MKKLLLLVLLLGTVGTAQAQFVNLIATGLRLGVSAGANQHRKNRDAQSSADLPSTPDINVVPASYRGQPFPQKRTPAAKLKSPGGEQIAYQEGLLQKCQATMTADSAAAIGNAELWATLKGSLEVIARQRPTWNTQAYADEAAFYQAEDARRQRVAQAAAPH